MIDLNDRRAVLGDEPRPNHRGDLRGDSNKAMKPLVSVVIPAIRDDAYLEQAIASVLDDGYPHLDVVVVWDGPAGTDIRCKFPGVRYLKSGGHGTSAANNLGFDEAKGEFIARLDADDLNLAGRLEKQVQALQLDRRALLAVGNAVLIDEATRCIGAYPPLKVDSLPTALTRSNPLVHSSFMFRRSPLRYDVRCRRMQDYELALRAAATNPLATVNGPVVAYRLHPRQSGRSMERFVQSALPVLRSRRALARKSGLRVRALQPLADLMWVVAQLLTLWGFRDRYARLSRIASRSGASTK